MHGDDMMSIVQWRIQGSSMGRRYLFNREFQFMNHCLDFQVEYTMSNIDSWECSFAVVGLPWNGKEYLGQGGRDPEC